MRRFILQSVIFISVIVIIIITTFIISNVIIKKNASFRIDNNVKYLVFGHSHSECAFNDSLIVDFSNYSSSADTYYYIYFKVINLIKQNPSVEVVLIDYSNNQINSLSDKNIWNDMYLSNKYPLFSPFMNISDHNVVFENSFSGFINALSVSLKHNTKTIIKSDFNYSNKIGGYLYLKRDSLFEIGMDSIQCNQIISGMSNYNLRYLEKIVDFCRKKNVKIFFVRSPVHSKYGLIYDDDQYESVLKTKFPNVKLLDFNNTPIKNCEFGDLHHLNYLGAKRFSIWFNKLILDDLFEKQNIQQYIDDEMDDMNKRKILKESPN